MLRLPYVTPLLLVISLLDVQMGRLPFQPPCTRKPEVVWNLSKPLTFGDWCRLASKMFLPLPVKCQRMVCNRDLFTNNDRDTCCFIQPFSASHSYTAVLLYSILYHVFNKYRCGKPMLPQDNYLDFMVGFPHVLNVSRPVPLHVFHSYHHLSSESPTGNGSGDPRNG